MLRCKRCLMACPRFLPEAIVSRALASCSTIQATVEKTRAHSNVNPKPEPAEAAVVMVPGPINAAEKNKKKSMLSKRLRKCLMLTINFQTLSYKYQSKSKL